jgi:hypothetical protein
VQSGLRTYEDREREAIQWVEQLSPEQGEAVLKRAVEEWDELVRSDRERSEKKKTT